MVGVREAAFALSVSERTIWALIARGEIQPVRLGGRTLIRVEDLRDLVDSYEKARTQRGV